MPIFLNFPLTSSLCHVKGHASLPLEDMNKKIYPAKGTSAIVKTVEKRKEIQSRRINSEATPEREGQGSSDLKRRELL